MKGLPLEGEALKFLLPADKYRFNHVLLYGHPCGVFIYFSWRKITIIYYLKTSSEVTDKAYHGCP